MEEIHTTALIQKHKATHSATDITLLYDGGITLRSGRRGFAVYRDGKVVALKSSTA